MYINNYYIMKYILLINFFEINYYISLNFIIIKH